MISVNGYPVEPTIFPDNTSQVWKLPPSLFSKGVGEEKHFQIKWQFTHESEFIHLAQLKQLLDTEIVNCKVSLVLSYLPYARQDKEISNDTTWALHTFAALINFLNFETVAVLDVHSNVAKKLIPNLHNTLPEKEVNAVLHRLPVYPDKGARQKYSELYGRGVYGEKMRDERTGEITSYDIRGEYELKDRDVLVIDDICDGGATFIELAHRLKQKGVRSMELFVTHGLFTKGTRRLFEAGYSRVFTAQGEIGPRHGASNV